MMTGRRQHDPWKCLTPSSPHLRDIFYLPTELITIITEFLCDKDLYILTRISHRMGSIACPIYLTRKKLVFLSHTNTVSVRDEAFKALDVWRRSPGFSVSKRLDCSFSSDLGCAASQVAFLHSCLNTFPSYPWNFFNYVRLTDIQTINISDLLHLLQAVVSATVCSEFTVSGFSCPKVICGVSAIRGRARKVYGRQGKNVVAASKSLGTPIFLDSVQILRLTRFSLSPSQWEDFLSSLYLPSLCELEIWGASSAMATCGFLQRHPNIRKVKLFRSQWEVATPSFDYLSLSLLQTLHGYLYQTLHILECNLHRPSLHDLIIEANPLTDLRQFKFFDGVVRCLTMCQGSPTLQILLPKQSRLFPLTLEGVRARAARKLHSNKLPEIESLCIGFVDMDDSIPILCELWMSLFSHLQEARLFVVEHNILFGTVFRGEDKKLSVVWDALDPQA